jgi:cell division protein FtsL
MIENNSKKKIEKETEKEKEKNIQKHATRFSGFNIFVLYLLVLIVLLGLVGGVFLNTKFNTLSENIRTGFANDSQVSVVNKENNEIISYNYFELYKSNEELYTSSGKYLWTERVPVSQDCDAQGVLMTWDAAEQDFKYNPSKIAVYGLAQFGNYSDSGEKEYLEGARAQADWLIENMAPDSGLFVDSLSVVVSGTNDILEAPWCSASFQGYACSLFARMYAQTDDQKYREAAILSTKPLEQDLSENGLVRDFYGHPFFEEYPTKTLTFGLVGHMVAMVGLYDVWQLCDDSNARIWYEKGVATLEYALPFFDSKGLSLSHLGHLFKEQTAPALVSTSNHKSAISYLEIINQQENSKRISYYIAQWIEYVNGPMR